MMLALLFLGFGAASFATGLHYERARRAERDRFFRERFRG